MALSELTSVYTFTLSNLCSGSDFDENITRLRLPSCVLLLYHLQCYSQWQLQDVEPSLLFNSLLGWSYDMMKP